MGVKSFLSIAEKAFPGAKKAVHEFFTKTYDDMSTHMSKDSAFEAAKKETRSKIKIEPETKTKIESKSKGGLSGGVHSGPPPLRGPEPQGLDIQASKDMSYYKDII
jgi:hypothetical protein